MAQASATASVGTAFAAIMAGDIIGAIAIYRELLRHAPQDRALHNSLGVLLLRTGDFAAGWEECEWRDQRPMPVPRWQGAPLGGARILVHGEQGFGDNFQFARYASLVAARGGTVVVATREGLRSLLTTVPGVTEVIETGEAVTGIQCHIPMLSLPHIFGTRLDSIPGTVPYIAADAGRVDAWRRRLAIHPGLHVGLVWSGNTEAVYNARRSPRLAGVRPLLDCPGVTFFALQKGGGRADLEDAPHPASLVDLGPELTDFSETAAVMVALDLIISPCTSTTHLAGALARPLWVMLNTDADWRWLDGRDDSPWYPTARLFRQTTPGDWNAPMARMRAELENLAR